LAPRIVFHHIPKCGGTSLVRGFALTYYPMRLLRHGRAGFPANLDVRAAEHTCDLLGLAQRQFRISLLDYHLSRRTSPLVAGHYPFSRAVYEAHKNEWSFITLLRDPVNRWYSEYFYNRHKSAGSGQTNLDIEAYLESPAGRAATRSFVNALAEPQDPTARATEAEVGVALGNLSCFDVVGRLEDLDAFREAMKRRFGRRPRFPHVNRSPVQPGSQRRPDMTSEFHRALLDFLAADLEIYAKISARKSNI